MRPHAIAAYVVSNGMSWVAESAARKPKGLAPSSRTAQHGDRRWLDGRRRGGHLVVGMGYAAPALVITIAAANPSRNTPTADAARWPYRPVVS